MNTKLLTEQAEQNFIVPRQQTENIPRRKGNMQKETQQSSQILLAQSLT